MIILYLLMLGFAIFAIGISGVALSRNFLVIMFSIEIMLVAASLVAVSMFNLASDGNIVLLLFMIWSIAAIETAGFVALYRHFAKSEPTLDVTKLSKYKN
jgi:NADH:ubiquinone oxidoreductase subunit K